MTTTATTVPASRSNGSLTFHGHFQNFTVPLYAPRRLGRRRGRRMALASDALLQDRVSHVRTTPFVLGRLTRFVPKRHTRGASSVEGKVMQAEREDTAVLLQRYLQARDLHMAYLNRFFVIRN